MKLYGQAESCANRIIEAFRSGRVPQALSKVFIQRNDNIPCRAWSWSNQLLTALAGYDDARGFRQWLDVGRGSAKAKRPLILAPTLPIKETTDDAVGGQAWRFRLPSVPVSVWNKRTLPTNRYG
jgi:hypothetical protein